MAGADLANLLNEASILMVSPSASSSATSVHALLRLGDPQETAAMASNRVHEGL